MSGTIDREKVIERLKKVSYYFKSLLAVGWQGDADIYREHRESVNMALALLKEQEPVKPKTENDGAPSDIACWWYVCGNCGCTIGPGDDYCRHCGRAVNWDED